MVSINSFNRRGAAFTWHESFSLVRNFRQSSFQTILLFRDRKPSKLLRHVEKLFSAKAFGDCDYKKYHFQQDGARPHTAESAQAWLTSKFGPCDIPCDLFCGVILRRRRTTENIGSSKSKHQERIKKIPKDALKSTFCKFQKKV